MRKMEVRKLQIALVCALPFTLTIVSCNKSGSEKKLASEADLFPQVQGVSVQSLDGANSTCIDTDPLGDGWGWNGSSSCRLEGGAIANETAQPVVLDNCQKLQSGDFHITELVTDVILTAGQSNAAGANTQYDPVNFHEDRVNHRLIVWTEQGKWEVADPANQTWHNGKYPSGRGNSFNHPAFQIGRSIADLDECRVVGLITTAASGKEIDHWRENREGHFTEIGNTVTDAINALPTRHQVDMIWWMQGEADNDPFVDRYYSKLIDLIAMFRGQAWFSTDGYFLANETGWFPHANEAIRLLRTDGDELTDYSRAEHSPADPFPSLTEYEEAVHFNEIALRKIGYIVADKYLYDFLGK